MLHWGQATMVKALATLLLAVAGRTMPEQTVGMTYALITPA